MCVYLSLINKFVNKTAQIYKKLVKNELLKPVSKDLLYLFLNWFGHSSNTCTM